MTWHTATNKITILLIHASLTTAPTLFTCDDWTIWKAQGKKVTTVILPAHLMQRCFWLWQIVSLQKRATSLWFQRVWGCPLYHHTEDFKVSQRAQVDGERTIAKEDASLLPNITTGLELLFSHSHHNSFILTALRWGQVRTNPHVSSSICDVCFWFCICIHTAFHFHLSIWFGATAPLLRALETIAFLFCFPPPLYPSVLLSSCSLFNLSHSLSLPCFSPLDVPAPLTHMSSQAEHTCVLRSLAARVGASVCTLVYAHACESVSALQWVVILLLN